MDSVREIVLFALAFLVVAKGISAQECPGEMVTITCESSGNSYKVCPVGDGTVVIDTVTVDILQSNVACNYFPGNYLDYTGPDGSYGYTKNLLWVDRGCSAQFKVCPVPGCPLFKTHVNCSSWQYQFKECEVPGAGKIIFAVVNHRYSVSVCENLGDNSNPPDYAQNPETPGIYGYQNDILWVNSGCRAEFLVCYAAPCGLHGDPHLETVDNTHYTFGGNCTYYLVTDLASSFSIKGDFFHCRPHRPSVSCLYALIIEFEGYTIKLERKKKVYIDGSLVANLPYVSGDGKVEIVVTSEGIKVVLDNGVFMVWDGKKSAKINLPPNFQGNTMGLCGTFDSNGANDFMLPDGTIADNVEVFGAGWVVPGSCPVTP